MAETLKEQGVDTFLFYEGKIDVVMACQVFGIRTIGFRHELAAVYAPHVLNGYLQVLCFTKAYFECQRQVPL